MSIYSANAKHGDDSRNGRFIQTYLGNKFWPLDPREEEVHLADIAHALSNQCRFSGHTSHFYSVAQHCILTSTLCTPENALASLMHDASEAYLVDVPRPIKPALPEYLPIEAKIMEVIAKKFGFAWPLCDDVRNADNIMLHVEKNALMKPLDWSQDTLPDLPKYVPTIVQLTPKQAEELFLLTYYNLKDSF